MSLQFYRSHKLVERLLDREIITREQLDEAIHLRRTTMAGTDLIDVLVLRGYVTLADVCEDIAHRFDTEFVRLSDRDIPESLVKEIDPRIAHFYRVVPIRLEGDTLTVAMDDPTNLSILESLARMLDRPLEAAVATPDDVSSALRKYYGEPPA